MQYCRIKLLWGQRQLNKIIGNSGYIYVTKLAGCTGRVRTYYCLAEVKSQGQNAAKEMLGVD
jgi:hypothetical protein